MYSWLSLGDLHDLERVLTDKSRNAPRSPVEAPSNAWARFSKELGIVRTEIEKRKSK
jgi:hypothetical protein